MESLKILKPEDVSWQEYRNLRLEALKEEPQAFASSYEDKKNDSDEKWKKQLEQYIHRKNSWMIFASIDKEIVGMLGAFQTAEDIDNKAANIIAVYVKKGVRGKGISKLLMSNILEELKKAQLKTVKLSVNTEQAIALKLYESFGFKITKKENVVLGDGKHYDEYLMEKSF